MASYADLTYNIVEQTLRGKIGGAVINADAVSGGRAGSKTRGAVNPMLANNPYATGVKLSDDIPGGPLPLATYELRTHETRANWIRLVPLQGQHLKGRSGFAIHGRGQRGSDGCIVPLDFRHVLLIHRLVKREEEAGRRAPTLEVVAIGDLGRFDRLMNMA